MALPSPLFIHSSHFRNAFFGSETWQHAWQNTWGLVPAVASSPNKTLYTYATRLKKYLPVTLATRMGQSLSGIPSIRSEYQFFSSHEHHSQHNIQEFIEQAKNTAWHQLWLSDIPTQANEFQLLKQAFSQQNWPLKTYSVQQAYGVDTRCNWQDYLNYLGKNTRLHLYNRRKNLEQLGSVTLHNAWPNLSDFIALLNGFHLTRWANQSILEPI